jgi:acetyl-CoA carboxylase carboxyl transferase subunit beta
MPTARELLDVVFDPGTWSGWDIPVSGAPEGDPEYARALAAARERTGLDESVLTGEGRLAGRRVAAIATDFGFLGGSVGAVAADRLLAAVRRATVEGLPVLASTASGGTRIQEGAPVFARLAGVAAAVGRHIAAGLPYLVYLRNPTTGGVLASWGSLGQVTAAEPGALVGYHGPRATAALTGAELPPGVQTAEHLYLHRLVDAVVPPVGLRALARRVLDVACGPVDPADPADPADPVDPAGQPGTAGAGRPDAPAPADLPAWEVVERSRRPNRPGAAALLTAAGNQVTPLADPGPGMVLALARFGSAACVLVGQDRGGPAPGPAELRAARRALRLAAELRLPLVSVVDTGVPQLSQAAEEGGLAAEVARTVAELAALPVPTVCLLLGQGAGGAALAFLPADRVVAAQHGWLSPLPPEGAAAILYRDPGRAAELAARQRIRAADLLAAGVVDVVVPEYPDAAEEPLPFLRRVGATLAAELAGLAQQDPAERLAARAARFAAR